MKTLFLPLFGLLFSIFILLIGHGVQLTVLPLFAFDLGWSASQIGFTGSAYFLGFVLGCLFIPRLVSGVGHIRVFGVLTSSATVALLLIPLLPNVPAWIVARLVTGWSIAGLYMVIESWLNERSTTESRGVVLSIYTMLTLVSISIGQLLTGFGLPHTTFILIGAMLLALGSIPVGLTRSPAPNPIVTAGFQFRRVCGASQVAVIGAIVGGLTTSGYWVLGPVVASTLGLDSSQIGIFLATGILGGALLQLPVGKLSDRVDRRLVLAGLSFVGALVCLLAVWVVEHVALLYVTMFLFGGTTFPLYPISLAHANDNTSLSLIEVGSVILLAYGAGSIVGPVVIAQLMEVTTTGMFVFSGVTLIFYSVWTLWRARNYAVERNHFGPFPDTPRTTIEVLEVAEGDSVTEKSSS